MQKQTGAIVCAMLGLVLALLAGCGGEKEILNPELTLVSFRVTQVKLLAGKCEMDIRISNPNPDPVTIEGMRTVLSTNRESFAKGMSKIKEKIDGYSQADVTIPGTVSNLSILQIAGKANLQTELEYAMHTSLTFREQSGARHTITIRETSKMPLLRLAPKTDELRKNLKNLKNLEQLKSLAE